MKKFDFKIEISDFSSLDLKESFDYYERQQTGLGKRFIGEIKKNIDKLKNNPFLFQRANDILRRVVMDVFPFKIYYRILENDKIVKIEAILHDSRSDDVLEIRINS